MNIRTHGRTMSKHQVKPCQDLIKKCTYLLGTVVETTRHYRKTRSCGDCGTEVLFNSNFTAAIDSCGEFS